MYKIETVIAVMLGELGYLEKKSEQNLDSKTANAGYGNYTKYWRDIRNWGYGNYQGQSWCAAFVFWSFVKAYGKAAAKKLLLHAPYISVGTMYNLAKKANKLYVDPQVGDVALFGVSRHTEFVVAVSDVAFATIGGNTSAGSTVVPNGGGVYQKTYLRSEHRASGTRFFRPSYGVQAQTPTEASQTPPNASQGGTSTSQGNAPTKVEAARNFNATIAGKYTVVPDDGLNLRVGAGTNKQKIMTIPKSGMVQCYGYYTQVGTVPWLYVVYKQYTGFVASKSTTGKPYLI